MSDDYYISLYYSALESLASCAIEGNQLAIDLLNLKDTDYEAFVLELVKHGFLKEDNNEST